MSAPHHPPKPPVITNAYTPYPPPEASYEQLLQNPQFFLEKLHRFHLAFGTKFKVPTLGGKALDLHRLFIEVTSRGGIEKIVRDRRWKEVMIVFKYGPTFTNASFVLRKHYYSLLYHFEQVYYFQKRNLDITGADKTSRFSNGSGFMHDALEDQFSESVIGEVDGHVTGTIDEKFEHGYMITVNMGAEELKGVLYHLPFCSYSPATSSHGNPNMYQLALREPSPSEANESGYDVFFTEHYIRLKPLYQGLENVISKRIQILWSTLTEEEKQVYQEKGSRDRER